MATDFTNKRLREGHLFLLLFLLLWALMLCFVGYQYSRERQFKIDKLNSSLQQLNVQLADELNVLASPEELFARNADRYEGLRITLLNLDGDVIYDSQPSNGDSRRKSSCREVIQALSEGAGYTIDGSAQYSKSDEYFYSATKVDSLVIRSALPYSITLAEVLQVDNLFFVVSMVITLLLVGLGCMTYCLIARLKQAAIDLDKEHSAALREQQEHTRLKRQLTNNINHELKTPICSILGYLDMVINNDNLSEESSRVFVQKSYDQAERLRRLMIDLSTITRIDEASDMIEREVLSLGSLIDGIVDDVFPQAEQQGINIINSVNEEVAIMGNNNLLYSIFRNLVDNAIAYSGARSVWIELLSRTDDKYSFVVRDNGIGVDDEHLPYIFERFYRVDSGRSRKMGGTGLGLSIVKNAVLFHGGEILAKRSERNGLEFHFTLNRGL